ncbi:MAG: L-serine ammonia-lyase, iron-sulfur-dependent, subunit alpha [Clostridiales bacterium]|nr:L-serine ammonia-lyase, iron-sulfur-dependent, subunit alpha [Clostridiales bacterium]
MFKSIQDLVALCGQEQLPISAIMIRQEVKNTERSEAQVIAGMAESFQVMKAAAQRGIEGVTSHSGMTGGDAKRLNDYLQAGQFLTDTTFLKALTYAVASNEVNAAMGLICATPTAGSCGVLPGVLLAAQDKLGLRDEDLVKALFCAGAIGYVIANNAMISGAAGGCQAEIGSASAMAAAALVELMGGSPHASAQAMAIALKNMLGLACDPLAGLVEVPCIKRNAGGAANALAAAEMALAGIDSKVPPDEVIEAMYRVGQSLPLALKETAQGGLAATETGRKWKELLWQSRDEEA